MVRIAEAMGEDERLHSQILVIKKKRTRFRRFGEEFLYFAPNIGLFYMISVMSQDMETIMHGLKNVWLFALALIAAASTFPLHAAPSCVAREPHRFAAESWRRRPRRRALRRRAAIHCVVFQNQV